MSFTPITNNNLGTYQPSVLTEVTLDSSNDIISTGKDIENVEGEDLIEAYIHENLMVCPKGNTIKLTLGKSANSSIKLIQPKIYNLTSTTGYLLKIVFNNIWKFGGNATLGDAGVLNIQHGYFGLCQKILTYKESLSSLYFILNSYLVLDEEEIVIQEAGGILWKNKVIISEEENLTNLSSQTPPSGYEDLKAYKIGFDFKNELYYFRVGTDIEFFSLRESNLDLRLTGTEYKLNKELTYDQKTFNWSIPTQLVIKNELIQCYPEEGVIYDNLFNIIDYGVSYAYTYSSGVSGYYSTLKIWCPNTNYLSQQIISLGAYYNSVEITDLKNCVRQFKIIVANPSPTDNFIWRMVFHLNYKDNLGNAFSRDYNVVFKVIPN